MDRGAWWATIHRVSKSRTRLNRFSRREEEQAAGLLGGQKRMPEEVMLELRSREEEEHPGAGTLVCKGGGVCDGRSLSPGEEQWARKPEQKMRLSLNVFARIEACSPQSEKLLASPSAELG